MVVILLTLN